jgi:hypothetical protein
MIRLIVGAGAALAVTAGIWMLAGNPVLAHDDRRDDDREENRIRIIDHCDPDDPAWAPTGGCLQEKKNNDVTNAEFSQFLFSPLGGGSTGGILIGHPARRNDPPYLTLGRNEKLHVVNKGGRVHAFTEVADFGGGRVPGLNGGLAQTGACCRGCCRSSPR